MPVVMRPSVMYKGDDGMARPTSSNCACCPRAMKASHALRLTIPCVLSKGDDGMTRPTSSLDVCYQRAKMACQTRRRSNVYAAQWRWHITLGRSKHGRTTSDEASIISLGQNTHGQTTSSVACHYRPWTTYKFRKRQAWHAIIAFV